MGGLVIVAVYSSGSRAAQVWLQGFDQVNDNHVDIPAGIGYHPAHSLVAAQVVLVTQSVAHQRTFIGYLPGTGPWLYTVNMMREHTRLRKQTASSETAHAPADPLRRDLGALDLRGQSHPDKGIVKSPSTNLLLPRSPLIGRDHEVTAIQHLLLQDEVGLLTLTGPGGIGKTRLALQVAANLLDHFVDGVYFVSLAATYLLLLVTQISYRV